MWASVHVTVVVGNRQDEDIEGDFDPEEHDRRMRTIFDDQYYGDADDEKPVFPDLDEELEIGNKGAVPYWRASGGHITHTGSVGNW